MNIVTVLGARPQFVKAAVLSRKFLEYQEINEYIIHTGQHFDDNMSEIFFREMGIPKPHFSLGINSSTHGSMTGKMIEGIEAVLLKMQPDWLLVYGDTNSTLAGSLAAKKLNIKIAHVEAGLRSFNMFMPEEVNRILTDKMSSILFCPSDTAIKNLSKEGFDNNKFHQIFNVGDIMEDASILFETRAVPPNGIHLKSGFVLVTIHRAENTDNINRLINIFKGLKEISKLCKVVIPMHPRTRLAILNSSINTDGIEIIEPVGYLSMIWLIKNSTIIMTDSGGVQKEAYFFNKFCITMRDETEWIELVENGYNYLVGDNVNEIIAKFNLLHNKSFIKDISLYGGGGTADKIVSHLKEYNEILLV